MKKSTLEAMYNFAKNDTAISDEVRADIIAEYERTTAKSRANADLYATAHDVLMNVEGWDEPLTSTEIVERFGNDLPEGFTKSKVQYAMRALWTDDFIKHDNGKNPYTYTRKG